MSTGRRIFLYTAALIGLLIVLASLLVLSSEAIRLWNSGVTVARTGAALVRESILWIGLGLAGLILWAVGWLPANAAARQLTLTGAAERASTLRKAYLYTGQLLTLAVGLAEAGVMTAELLRRLLGEPTLTPATWPGWAFARAAGAVVALVFWGHLRWVAIHDGDFGSEHGRGANWRRAYFYLGALGGFVLVIAGAIGYLRAMLGLAGSAFLSSFSASPMPTAAAWREPIVSSVTALVIGIPLAVFIWSTASRLAAGAPVREHGALSRVTLLHAGLVFGTAASLASTAYLLQQGLLVVTGGSANTGPAWSNLITPLACLPVSLVGWLAFASAARHTVVLSQAAPGAVAVRRITFYLLAAAGLVTFSFGMALLWRVILSGVAGSPVGRFSLGAALVLVGAPAWWGYWWPRQVRARQAGVQGIDERNSVARKTYLYGIIGAMAVVLVLPLVAFALQGVKGSVAAAVAGTTGALAAGGIALFWLITHLLVMRGDRRWRAADRPEPAAAPPPEVAALPAQPALAGAALTAGARSFRREDLAALAASAAFAAPVKYTRRAVVVVDGGNGGLGASLLAALHNALPETPLWPVGLNPGAQAAMLAALGDAAPSTVPSDALARASAILGPTDLLLPGGLGGEVDAQLLADLASSPARLILLPPRDPRLRWVAAPEWPDERWVENAVIEVSNVG